MSWVAGVDVGGTFTDILLADAASGRRLRHKVPSSPADPAAAILRGVEALAGSGGVAMAAIARLAHGTTAATNALIERRGGVVSLITTAGFRDVLEIGRQTRPKLYDFRADHPEPLVPRQRRLEARERIGPAGEVIEALSEAEIGRLIEAVRASGCDSIAVGLLFAFANPAHEQKLGSALRAAFPGCTISLSCEVQPEFREYERISTTVLNAFLQPMMGPYMGGLAGALAGRAAQARLDICQSSGGLMPAERAAAMPVRTVLSGPAAGVIGAQAVAAQAGYRNVITFDMGGTSTDVCLVREAVAETSHGRSVAGFPVRLAAVDIHTVGAGGGSIARIDRDGLLKVGPSSAGAEPGPACYGRGGTEPTVSDANLVLGRLPEALVGGGMRLDPAPAEAAIAGLGARLGMTAIATALGIVRIVNSNMVRAIRAVSVERGFDPRGFALMAFGGAGPLHAVEVAREIGISAIIVPPMPGILCAEGVAVADLEESFVATARTALGGDLAGVRVAAERLSGEADRWTERNRIAPDRHARQLTFDMRYVGQNYELPIPVTLPLAALEERALQQDFHRAHQTRYGHHDPQAAIEIVNVRLVVRGSFARLPGHSAAPMSAGSAGLQARSENGALRRKSGPETARLRAGAPRSQHREVWFGESGAQRVPVIDRDGLAAGAALAGPAILTQFDATTLLPPGCRCRVLPCASLLIELRAMNRNTNRNTNRTANRNALDPVTLEIVWNGLKSVTDECFITLQRSAFSTNIKERHDHSTAIADRAGRLVAQAELALPIHIASMTGLMTALLAKFEGSIEEGDIFIANDPHVAGGTHLPDINLAMPVVEDGRIVAFICDIAHHADVGGAAAGSMSGGLREIWQEGLRIPVTRLYRRGELQADVLDLILLNMRLPEERRGDLNAQIAACHLGVQRLQQLLVRYGKAVTLQAFDEIIARTEGRLRLGIAEIPDGRYAFSDVLDDDGLGTTNIRIALAVEKEGERILFDFTGSDPQVAGNVNLTLNAVQSCVCYALKAMLDPDLPNNQGVIDAIEILAPEGSIVNCRPPGAVALRANTSQRVIDVVIGALAPVLPARAIGAANGANTSMVFAGTDPRSGARYVYLETLGGGMGARVDADGKDGVQVHITNTSNLPVEAIEMEYPLRVEEYALVEDSGGPGRFRGGMGLRRIIRPVGHICEFNGVGERFAHAPWGIFGGGEGARGRFMLQGPDGTVRPLPHKTGRLEIGPDERVIAETPGAGGYGAARERSATDIERDLRSGKFTAGYATRHYKHGDR